MLVVVICYVTIHSISIGHKNQGENTNFSNFLLRILGFTNPLLRIRISNPPLRDSNLTNPMASLLVWQPFKANGIKNKLQMCGALPYFFQIFSITLN